MRELLKVIAQPVVLERDAAGNVIGEQIGNPLPLYSVDEAVKLFTKLREELEAHNEAQAGEAEGEKGD